MNRIPVSMKAFIAVMVIIAAATFCEVKAFGQQDAKGNYVNTCENFGAMAVAVMQVKTEKLMTLNELITSQTEYFKKSGLNDQEVFDLIKMISYVYQFQVKLPDSVLFEYYGNACIEQRKKDLKES